MKKSFQLWIVSLIALLGTACGENALNPQSTKQEKTTKQETPAQQPVPDQLVNFGALQQNYIQNYGVPQMEFKQTSEGLNATITTKRLVISPIKNQDLAEYMKHLYGSPQVMKQFREGKLQTKEFAQSKFKMWTERWQQGIPFSAFTIRDKATQDFIGHVVLGGGDNPNSGEIAYMLRENLWGKHLGSEAAGAIALFYAPELKKQGYVLPNKEVIETILVTTRRDNTASVSILQNLGMHRVASAQKFGYIRDYYEIELPKATTSNEVMTTQ